MRLNSNLAMTGGGLPTFYPSRCYAQSIMKISRKLKGWSRPWMKTAPHVWEHSSGLRCIPCTNSGALVRWPDGETFSGNHWNADLRKAREIQGSRKRGGLMWANQFIA